MHVELVHTTTSDHMRLDGALHVPPSRVPENSAASTDSDSAKAEGLDACLMLHGVGGNFYGSSLLQTLSARLQHLGIAVLRVNTRGHDGLHTTRSDRGVCYQGAAFEIVDECRRDMEAWLGWLEERGYRRIGLCGHSLGAIKAVYSQAQSPAKSVAATIAISPPRLSAQAFQNGSDSPKYFASLQEARKWVDAGEPQRLILSQFPFPLYITAGGYLDKYGGERYNIEKFVDRVPCPTLYVYGRRELDSGSIAFAGLDESIGRRASQAGGAQAGGTGDQERASGDLHVRVIADADHFYTDVTDSLATEITDWLKQRRLLPCE